MECFNYKKKIIVKFKYVVQILATLLLFYVQSKTK